MRGSGAQRKNDGMDEPQARLNAADDAAASSAEAREDGSRVGVREFPPPRRKGFWGRHRWLLWVCIAAAVVLVALTVALSIAARRFEPFLKERVVASLSEHFHTRVELDSLHIAVRHGEHAMFGLWATGKGLRIWPPNPEGGWDSATASAVANVPLIRLQEFSFHVPLRWEQRQFLKIPQVRLKGLEVHVPPRAKRSEAAEPLEVRDATPSEPKTEPLSNVEVERIDSEDALVVMETNKPDKIPLTFAVKHLKLRHVRAGQPMEYQAELTNPKPPGLINAEGKFGPWVMDDPGQSPVEGKYRFQHADLGVFKGIAGMLASNGTYTGTLHDLKVDGETVVPDFRLTQFGGKLPLHTQFHARVDGTNGDTWLDRVDAVLGATRFTTSGKVVRVRVDAGGKPVAANATDAAAQPGHVIDVKVDVPHGKMDDFLRLVSKSGNPAITGVVETKATLHIPPGDDPVNKRMKLDGFFKLDNAVFTSDKAQGKVQELSYRAQGRPDGMKFADPKTSTWEMQGDFHVANGVIALPDLVYGVQGAQVQLHGTYNLDGEVSMDGTARMDATVSQMVGGWKGFLLKPADRFFKKDGAGTQVPIRVRGTRDQPDFSVDFGKMGNGTHPERPQDSGASGVSGAGGARNW
ncbi:AsmA-like C-terminal region-containing protein [Occallatibacter riparius]|uniref:AsmA-like C-terminal region-containing protein n=1 Tax=Occallatibacter riparius TaxID=1002689 RepID=A0A9J7BT05_9BACT|nr:AsmA-like C-terminal region-containing protein [Occallatibacter riparius]UWZ84882.1 AsmA-like C-terminal region-containing protein [Occallatibacter riparius]